MNSRSGHRKKRCSPDRETAKLAAARATCRLSNQPRYGARPITVTPNIQPPERPDHPHDLASGGFLIPREMFRYLIAGSIAFAVDLSLLLIATNLLGLHYLIGNAMGYCLGLAVVYLLNTRWVFSHRAVDNRVSEFAIFALIGLCGIAISEGAMYVLVENGELALPIAKAVATIAVFMCNFVGRKFFLFRRR
jgi:putative flippase GtrA